ncbi:MAG: lamin tail domain-containing protein, partial [Verrucomicrobia bacterium]|nr:lamin tail domain-containing protein [Verrucomicrobiota bacterium]
MTSRLVSLLLMFLSAAAPAAEVVINEIHYDPGDNTLRTEFIELWNTGPAGVDLSGWSLANAVSFTFTNGTQLAAGGFLLIAADPNALFAAYAVFAVGPCEGKLSNEGDHLELRDGSGALQDEVQYQAKFPWPVGSAGEGKSMSLINPSLDNNLGGSWRAATPTPGATNAVYSALAPPQIRQVNHTPNQPRSNEPIVITAKVTDPQG